jgi:hypothetical protein
MRDVDVEGNDATDAARDAPVNRGLVDLNRRRITPNSRRQLREQHPRG